MCKGNRKEHLSWVGNMPQVWGIGSDGHWDNNRVNTWVEGIVLNHFMRETLQFVDHGASQKITLKELDENNIE